LFKAYTIDLICKDNIRLTLSPKLYGLLIKGFLDELFNDLNCREGIVSVKNFAISFRELLISEVIFDSLRFGWRYNISYSYWFRNNLKFRHMRNYILEVFDYKEYDHLNVENRYIVDIGAGYGETAIYFILRGAEHVVAIEPCPDVFNELLENLRLNNIMDKVSPINKAVASVHDRINIDCPSGNFVVDTISLKDIAKNINLDDAVLKMDCEGCEYDIILNEYEYVRQFNELYFEYHAYITKKPVEMLLKKLSKDFECRIVSDEDFYKRHGFNRKLLGLVKCVKK